MMKKTILIISTFLLSLCISLFSKPQEPDDVVFMKGIMGVLPSNSVDVIVTWDKTVKTTFNQKIDHVTVTVKNSEGNIVETQTLDAKKNEMVTIDLDNTYLEGTNIIEISTSDGILEGRF